MTMTKGTTMDRDTDRHLSSSRRVRVAGETCEPRIQKEKERGRDEV